MDGRPATASAGSRDQAGPQPGLSAGTRPCSAGMRPDPRGRVGARWTVHATGPRTAPGRAGARGCDAAPAGGRRRRGAPPGRRRGCGRRRWTERRGDRAPRRLDGRQPGLQQVEPRRQRGEPSSSSSREFIAVHRGHPSGPTPFMRTRSIGTVTGPAPRSGPSWRPYPAGRKRRQDSRCALIRSASARLMPGTAAICSTGASRTRFADPNTLSSSRLRFGPDARQVVEGRPRRPPVAQVPVVRDREPVRLVAEPLDQVQGLGRDRQQHRGPRDPGRISSSRSLARPTSGRSPRPSSTRASPAALDLAPSAVHDDQVGHRPAALLLGAPPRPLFAPRNRRRSTSWWLAKSLAPSTVLIRNRRYSPVRGRPSSNTTMLATDSAPWKFEMS